MIKPVPSTAIRAPVESATNVPVGTVRASVIWLAPSIVNVSPDDRGENRHRSASVGVHQPATNVGLTFGLEVGGVLGDHEQQGAAERDRSERSDPERASDGAPAQLERQRVAACQRVGGQRDRDR